MGQLAAAHPPPPTCYCQVTAGQLHTATCYGDKLLWVAGGRPMQVRKQVGRVHRAVGWVVGSSDGWGLPIFIHPATTTAAGLEPCVAVAAAPSLVCCCAVLTAPGSRLPLLPPLHQACSCHLCCHCTELRTIADAIASLPPILTATTAIPGLFCLEPGAATVRGVKMGSPQALLFIYLPAHLDLPPAAHGELSQR